MTDFAPVATSLRAAISDFYMRHSGSLRGRETTIATNSELVERRASPLLAMAGIGEIDGLTVLDLGCGFGAVSTYFAVHGAEVTGIDPNEERLAVGRDVAAAHCLPVRLRQGRMEALELSDCSFDFVIQNNSLCYLVDQARRGAALCETHRVLRPGGTLVTRNPNRWNPIDQFTGLPFIHLLPPATTVRVAAAAGRSRSLCRLMSPPAAKRELKAAGFTDIVQPGFEEGSGKPDALKTIARYQHFVARRSSEPLGGR